MRVGECLCAAGFLLQFLILLKCSAITATITTPVKDYSNASATDELMTLRNIGRSLTLCLTASKRWTCLERQLNRALVAVAEDDSTWQYGDFITVEKLPRNRSDVHEGQSSISSKERAQRQRALPVDGSEPVPNSIAASLLQIAKSRSIRLQLPSSVQALNKIGVGISDAIDLWAPTEPLTSAEAAQADAGRKKKGKDKNMAMMGGMALIAMVAQMFLGKVILIAGAAFVMAKIALLVSLLGSLKKGSTGSSGSTERIVVTSPGHGSGGDGGGHGHGHSGYGYDSGWHRSMPLTYPKAEIISEEPKHKKAHHHTPPQTHTPPDSYYYSKIIEAANEDASDDNRRRGAQSGFL
ncbi:uncharacterized protein LOC128855416 [Anastrepha ludens]|uniref:uncharacterized protein LOC128855416 n=1 Tax=Anastrepha ludens TaxID=28586 RepID=UPI0023B01744|nr:uncharacterized protein LOC128855416 [Anastrepha ludens]